VRIGHIELLDAEGENLLFHFFGVIGLEFQVNCLQKVALMQSGALIDKAEVDVIQLKAVHFIGFLLWLCSPGHRNKIYEPCPVLIARQKPPYDFQKLPLP
jgi:hypothetical protein